MAWLHRYPLATVALALMLVALPGMPRAPAQSPQQASPAEPQPSLAGLPLYTADGKEIGKVITMGLDDDDEPVLVAEIERRLGLGLTAIAVPTDMFARKGDRIELTLTEAEVDAKLRQ
jgi:hypothetical protein